MIGDSSSYPTDYDAPANVIEESFSGTAISGETKIIPAGTYLVTLDHWAKTGTISISGFTETTGTPSQGEFKVTDYFIPSAYQSHTGINYNIGKTLLFHVLDANKTIKISYTSPGDTVTASILNLSIDAIYKIQKTIGLLVTDLDIGAFSNICQYISYLYEFIRGHNHSGITGRTGTNKLSTSAFSDLAITDANIAVGAKISPEKLKLGIADYGLESINSGTDEVTVINSLVTGDSTIFLTRWHSTVGGFTDKGEFSVDPQDGQFVIKFIPDSSRTESIWVQWFLLSDNS